MSSSEDEDDLSILQSVKKGDLDALSYAQGRKGSQQTVMERGLEGETALHWACLMGRLDMIKPLLENGAEVATPVMGPTGNEQHPIHWAINKGHLHVVDYLLKNGASLEQQDGKGRTPLLVACQNAHVTLLLFLLSRGADLTARDNEGDSVLHWAAYKGQQEVCTILIHKGVDVNALDKCGQNPLHLACVEGKIGVVDCLLENGVDKAVVDKNGNTPVAIAKRRNHNGIVEILENKGLTLMGMAKYFTPMGFFFGAPGRHQQQLKLLLFEAFCLGYPYYLYKVLPQTLNDYFGVHMLFWVMSAVMWYSFYKIRYTDPGFLPVNSPAYQQGLDEIMNRDSFENMKMHTMGQGKQVLALPDFCHVCKIVRPPRSKHCKFCKRCVLVHDHHCPYLDQCIAYHNRVYFMSFVWSVNIIGYIAMFFLWKFWKSEPFSYVTLVLVINSLFFCFMVNVLVIGQFLLVTGNMTTWECATSSTMPNFRMFGGRYTNPYNRGMWQNTLEYFHLKAPADLRTIQPVTATESV